MYQSCATDGCNKKVIDLGNGLFRCEKCARETPNYKWRLLLSVSYILPPIFATDNIRSLLDYLCLFQVKIADMSGEHWITCFQDTAEALLGRSADDLGAIKETQVRLLYLKCIQSKHTTS